MKKRLSIVLSVTFLLIASLSHAQKRPSGADLITSSDLESHVSFLASPLLKGRENGQPGLQIAEQYILSQTKILGLKPASGSGYLQPYSIIRTTMDPEKTMVEILSNNNVTSTIKEPIFQLLPTGPSDFTLDGEVLFAGYGLKQDKYGYNDMENINAEGKILMIMSGAPTSEDGKKYLFEGVNWASFMSVQAKLTLLMFSKAKAIIIVTDPKSGSKSFDEQFPGISGQLNTTSSLKGSKAPNLQMPGLPKILYVHRSVADALLDGSGYTLDELQKKIDSGPKPFSFIIPGKELRITEVSLTEEITLNNVAGYIEGSDPALKNEFIIYSAHYDHVGVSGKVINYGADDNASGSAALLSIAKAFQGLDKKPLRSVMFLWVSGEEIGLYGSHTYVSNPLVPLKNTLVNLNVDMIGRIKGVADSTADNPMTGPNHVFVITGNQSKELLSVAKEVDNGTILDFDYSLSGRDHPLQLFSRSDHFNFVKKDIPVLFFSTGLHTDYHTPGDVAEKINFDKMELITKSLYQIGYNVANRKTRIKVDNPYSKW
jgi:hypothetical protein